MLAFRMIKSDMKPAVHVQADEIAAAFGCVVPTAEQTKRKSQPPGLDQIEESVIEEAVQQTSDPPVGHPRHRLEHYIMLGPSHLGPGHQFVNGAIRQHVSARLNPVDPEGVEQLSFVAWRKLAQHVSARRINVRLIEGDP